MNDPKAYRISDVLADPTHPAYSAAKDVIAKLERGELNLCACLGPAPGETQCPCALSREKEQA